MIRSTLRLGACSLELERGRPLLMGIVNASPESFYDGAGAGDLARQLERARGTIEAGADLIDVGGESGVTDRPPVSEGEEARRVVPLVEALASEGTAVSVDTWKPSVARAAVAAGAAMINDVSGLASPGIAAACAVSGAALVVAHTRAAPKVKAFPAYADVRADVVAFIAERLALAREVGVADEQLVVDPGPDLAKTPAETVAVLRDLGSLHALGRPLLLAVSRKDFVGAICGRAPAERLAGTLAAVGEGIDLGASIVRTHDVGATADFLAVRAALRGSRELPGDLRLDGHLRRQPRLSS